MTITDDEPHTAPSWGPAVRSALHVRADVRRGQRSVRRLHAGARLVHALAIDDGEQAVLAGAAQPVAHLVGAVAVVHHVALRQSEDTGVMVSGGKLPDSHKVRG